MQRGLRKIRSKTFPSSPKSCSEIIEIFASDTIYKKYGVSKGEEPLKFYRGTIENDEYSFCVFASEKIIKFINEKVPMNERKILLDATFKTVPVGCFTQLLIIHIQYINHVRNFKILLK